MAFEQYDIAEDTGGAVTVSFEGNVIATFPTGIDQTKQVNLIGPRGFTRIASASFFTCDNGSEHGYTFETGQYVAPHTAGIRLPFIREIMSAQVLARNDSLAWIVPAGGEVSTIRFYDSDPGALMAGLATPQIVTAQMVSYGGFVAGQTQDAAAQPPGYQTSAIEATAGYDAVTADGFFVPNRTPNVWPKFGAAGFPAGGSTTALYTAPPGQYWRLMGYNITFADMTAAPSNAFVHIQEGGTVILERLLPLASPFPLNMSTGWVNLPGAGLKATAPGSVLNLFTNVAGSTYTMIATAALYVGS